MSREAKIGLLVALAFVLVIGLLLSDHVTVATRDAQAPLAATGQSVRNGLTVPGNHLEGVVVPEAEVKVSRPYVSQPTAQQASAVTASAPDPFAEVVVTRSQPTETLAEQATGAATPLDPQAAAEWSHEQPNSTPASTLEQAAAAAGQPVETVESASASAATQLVRVQEYTAQPGDSLGKIARRTMGSDTPDTRSALLKLNPELARNPDLIIAGRAYKIPADAPAAATLDREPARPAAGGRTYTVKPGDVLGTIAQHQLGTSRRWKEIVALNGDLLSDPRDLQVGMVLQLPQ